MYALNVAQNTHWKLFLVYLKFKLNWVSCILSGISTQRLKRGIHLHLPEERNFQTDHPPERSWPPQLSSASFSYDCDLHAGMKAPQGREPAWQRWSPAGVLGSRSAPAKVSIAQMSSGDNRPQCSSQPWSLGLNWLFIQTLNINLESSLLSSCSEALGLISNSDD